MWFPWRRKKKRHVERVVVGLIIGGAIASIIGKKLLDHGSNEEDVEKKEEPTKE